MVIDVPNVRHIRPELPNHPSQFPPCLGRINCMGRLPGSDQWTGTRALEVNGLHEIAIIRRRFAPLVSHRKKRNFMPARAHQFHSLEEVNLGAAEGKVIFVAVQNSHAG